MTVSNTVHDVRLAIQSGLAVISLHVLYAAVTIGGFLSLPSGDAPMADPWFAAMEVLIILLGPPVLVFLSALRGTVMAARSWMTAATMMAAVTFALSAPLHSVLLVIGRDHALVAAGGLLGFAWPSAAYAIDILAWDWFFACALLCCALALRDGSDMRPARNTFAIAGVLSLAGLAGMGAGSMALRNVGILGYAVVFPCAVGLVLRALSRQAQEPRTCLD
jgi:hypothetical protein